MKIIYLIRQVFLLTLVVHFFNGCSENEIETSFENVKINLKHNEIFKDTIETFIDLGGIWLTSFEGLDSIDYSSKVTCLDGNINKGEIINDYTTSNFISLVKEGIYSECFTCGETVEIKLKDNLDTNVLCTYVKIQTGEEKIKHRDFDVLKSDAAGYPIFTEWIETVPIYGDSIINEYVGFYNKDSSLLRLVDYKRSDVIYFKLLKANYTGSFSSFLYEPRKSYLDVKIEDNLLTDSLNIITYNPLEYYDSLKSVYNIFSPYQNSFKEKYQEINKFFENRNLKYEFESEKIEMIEKLGFRSFFNERELSFKWGLTNSKNKDYLYHLIKNTNFEMQEHNDIYVFGSKTKNILKNNIDENYNNNYTYSDAGESIIRKIENLIFENFIINARLKNINLSNFTGEYSFFLSFIMDKGSYETKFIPIILHQEKYINEFYNFLEILLSNTEFDQSAAKKLKNFIIPIKIDFKLPFNYSRISKSHPKNFEKCCSLKPDSNFYLEISNNGTKNNFHQINPVKNILSFEKFSFLEAQMNKDNNAVNKSTISYSPQGKVSASEKGMPCDTDLGTFDFCEKKARLKNLTTESLIKKIKKILAENPIPHISYSKKIEGRLGLKINIDCNGSTTAISISRFSDVITDYFILKALRENLKIEWEPAEHRGNLVNSSFTFVTKVTY